MSGKVGGFLQVQGGNALETVGHVGREGWPLWATDKRKLQSYSGVLVSSRFRVESEL